MDGGEGGSQVKRIILAFAAIVSLWAMPADAQSMGATVILVGGTAVSAAAPFPTSVYAGTTAITATGSSLNVNLTNGGSGGTAVADEATFTPGTTSYTPAGCFFQTTATNNNLTNLQGGWLQCTARRAIFTNLDAIGSTAVVTSSAGVQEVGIVGGSGVRVDAAIAAAPPANALYVAGLGSGATGGELIGIPVSDTPFAKNITTATTTLIVTGVASRQVRFGSYEMYAGGADNVEWIEGTGATCGTGTQQLGSTSGGGTTSGTGLVFSAAGGVVHGSGFGTIIGTATAGDSVCLVTSAGVNLNVMGEYTIF